MSKSRGGLTKRVIAAAAIATLSALTLVTNAQPAQAMTCPSVNGQWASTGPFAVTSASNGQGATIFRPTNLGSLGCTTHPVILWSNGAGATVSSYTELLTHFASHGFIVAAYEGRSSDPATVLAGLDYLTSENGKAGSVYQGKVDLAHVGATGHSLGGGAAVGAGADPRVDTVAPMFGGPFNEPSQLRGPAVFFAAQYDWIVPAWVVRGEYNQASQVPAIYAELRGGSHFSQSSLTGPATAWFRFHLMGDEQARGVYFGAGCAYCSSRTWSVFERNAKAVAFPGP